MRRLRLCLAATFAAIALVSPARGAAAGLQPLGNFNQPIFVSSDPSNPNRLFVVQRQGLIKLVQGGQSTNFADLTSVVRCCDGERGLLSMAPAPDFAQSGLFYVDYTGQDGPGNIHVAELRANGDSAPTGSLRNVLTINHSAASNHNGGQLQFGPDGGLYVSTGDGGADHNTALDRNNLLGKILRIDPRQSGSSPYTIPPSNPFVGVSGTRGEVWAYGFRNPWRFSFDRDTGNLLIGDVGETSYAEVDYAAAAQGGGRGVFYGWDCREGFHAFPGNGFCPGVTGYTDPIFEYPHAGGACAITGGYLARDPSLGDLFGRYLYADLCTGQIRSLVPAQPLAAGDRSEGLTVANPVSFGEDSCGRLYVAAEAGPVSRFAGDGSDTCAVLKVDRKGRGRVTGPGIECPGDCVEVYPQARTVVLRAHPKRSAFARWGRDCSGKRRCSVLMNADRNVVARFRGRLHTHLRLTVASRRVPAGEKALLKVKAKPCKGRRHDRARLFRGKHKVAAKRLNRNCVAKFRPRITKSARYRVKLHSDSQHRAAKSRSVLIKPSG
jgi:Glucose / Sorbosone dehydrogenase